MTIQWDTVDFERGVNEGLKKYKLGTEKAVLALALSVEATAKGMAPVDTGNLRRSITHKPGRDVRGFYVDVGTNVIYAPFVEFGTRFMRPQPYLRPAFLQAVNQLRWQMP